MSETPPLQRIRAELCERAGYVQTRIDRLVHNSDVGFYEDGTEMRSIRPGSNVQNLTRKNRGRPGPLAIESGYGSHTVRVRMFEGHRPVKVWDLNLSNEDWPKMLDDIVAESELRVEQLRALAADWEKENA